MIGWRQTPKEGIVIRFRPVQFCFVALLLLQPTLADGAEEFEIVSLLGLHNRFLEPDARSIAMGTAVTAVAEGPAAAYWNLGFLGLPGPTGALSYSTRETGVRYHFFSAAGNWNGIGVGGHFAGMSSESSIRTIFDPSGVVRAEISHQFSLVGAGIDLGRYVPGFPEGMQWGTGLGIGFLTETVASSKGDGWDMDLGTILAWRLPLEQPQGATLLTLRTGYVLRDMWNRNLEIRGASIPLGRQDRLGVAATVESAYESTFGPLFEATFSWERRGLFYDWDGSRNQVGGEVTLAGVLSLRTGYVLGEDRFDDNNFNWGWGFGLKPGNPVSPRVGMQLDYAEGQRDYGADFDQFTGSVWVAL
jgi:hypothetical protein